MKYCGDTQVSFDLIPSLHTHEYSLLPHVFQRYFPQLTLIMMNFFSICFLKDPDSHTLMWKCAYFVSIQAHEFSQFEYTHVRSTQIERKTLFGARKDPPAPFQPPPT